MYQCKQGDIGKESRELTGRKCVGVQGIYNTESIYLKKTGGQSGESGSQSRSHFGHWLWVPEATRWEVGLIRPVKVLSGALNIDPSQCGVNMNMCHKCGVHERWPSLSASPSLLQPFRTFYNNKERYIFINKNYCLFISIKQKNQVCILSFVCVCESVCVCVYVSFVFFILSTSVGYCCGPGKGH